MRKTYEYGTTGSAVLDTPEKDSARPGGKPRRAASGPLQPPRELASTYANDEETEAFLRASGRNRRIRRGIIPRTRTGRIAAGISLVVALATLAAAATAVRHYALTSETFRIPSSAAIQIDGNNHLTRSQMLSVFGEDIERNIFKVPMPQRRAELEAMPWVEHATVMRLLPNRIRVHITERTPIAFVRQGGTIGMADLNGVLLDIPPDAPGNPNYSFPVVTGIRAADPLPDRARRMKLYNAFLHDIDSDGRATSAQLSEIDLSDSEDVKALIPNAGSSVLVHFGTESFLTRYKKFQDRIAEWRQTYPRLSGVDMRYERQVVLQMPPKDSTVVGSPQPANFTEVKPLATKPLATPSPKTNLAPAVARTTAAARPTTIARPAATAKPAHKPATTPARRTEAAKPNGKAAKDIAMQKRVEAIRAWMAKRQKLKETQAGRSSNPGLTP